MDYIYTYSAGAVQNMDPLNVNPADPVAGFSGIQITNAQSTNQLSPDFARGKVQSKRFYEPDRVVIFNPLYGIWGDSGGAELHWAWCRHEEGMGSK